MGKTTVLWRHGMHFCTHVESGELMCDESSETGKAYPSAPELLAASLGSCIGSVLVHYADRHGLDLEGMSITLDWEIAESPHRIGAIDVAVSIPNHLPPSRPRPSSASPPPASSTTPSPTPRPSPSISPPAAESPAPPQPTSDHPASRQQKAWRLSSGIRRFPLQSFPHYGQDHR